MVNVFENFRKICLEIYQLYSAKFLSAPGLVWQAVLKKTVVELELSGFKKDCSGTRTIKRYWHVVNGWKRN